MNKQRTEHLRYGSPSAIPAVESRKTIDTLLSHQSCRAFSDQPIDDEVKQLLFAAAQSAPSKSNLQQFSFIDVNCSSIRAELIQLFPSIRWALEAPMLIFIIGDTHRTQEINRVRNHTFRWEQTDAFLNATVDASLALAFMIAAAESISIGTCPVSKVRESSEAIAKLLKLPIGAFPICACAFGYPQNEAQPISPRLPQSVIVHRDHYQPINFSEIDRYDQTYNRIAGPPKARYPEKFGEPNQSTWSDNVARQTAVLERPDFRDMCESQGLFRKQS
ncbi:MAG: nitroreductase family protein [Litorivicinaceae bacterium]|jgi:FMN reductase [NAD(P)H]|nr:nitroreductase family protein [Litorivicinaceae bacterium]